MDGAFFFFLVCPQKVLSLHLKTKFQAHPRYSQFSVCKPDMAWSIVLVLELAGKFPSSICGMILANFGAKVFHMAWDQKDMFEFVNRRKQSLALNLKTPEGEASLRKSCLQTDVFIDPFPKGALRKGQTFHI